MNHHLRRVYEQFYDEYRFLQRSIPPFPSDFTTRGFVLEGIEQGLQSSGAAARVRIDARLLLVVNFHHLVAQPMALTSFGRGLPHQELRTLIAEDTAMIFAAITRDNPRGDITTRHVLLATAAVYDRLNVTQIGLWAHDNPGVPEIDTQDLHK